MTEVSQQHPSLDAEVYKICQDLATGILYLVKIAERFDFPYKIYGLEQPFIDRVIKSYHNTSGNLGIILNGAKGTGKTVTGRIICNELQLPVLIVSEAYEGLPAFLNAIPQDVIVFLDEYEKTYEMHNTDLLSVMDGVMNSASRRVFLLTTNQLYVNENLLHRPSRVRYVKTYENLDEGTIGEIVDDLLQFPEMKKAIIRYMSTLTSVSVDIVKSVIEEVNIHEELPEIFESVFNATKIQEFYMVFRVEDGKPDVLFREKVRCEDAPFDNSLCGGSFRLNGKSYGYVQRVISGTTVVVGIEEPDESAEREEDELVTYKLQPYVTYNNTFVSHSRGE